MTDARHHHLGYPAAAAVFAIGMAGTTLPTPLYGLYRERLGFSEFTVTIVFAVYAVGVIAALLLAGDFSDQAGRRPVLLTAVGLSAASALCFLFEGGLGVLFVGRVLSGLSAGLFSGCATATVMDLAEPGREGRAGLAATAANMGGLGLGPLLAGLLAEYVPHPLRVPFLVDLALLVIAGGLVLLLPETVEDRPRHPRLRPRGLTVPASARSAFTPSAVTAFAGFALLGLFTAVAPSFVAQTLGVSNLAVSGAIVFSAFAASTVGQAMTRRLGARQALPAGCLVLAAGVALVAVSLGVESLPVLVAGAVVGGLGQGLGFRGAMAAVSAAAPPDQKAGTISALFVAAYTGISLPVVGVGALSLAVGLRTAGIVFSGCVILLAGYAAAYLRHHPLPAG